MNLDKYTLLLAVKPKSIKLMLLSQYLTPELYRIVEIQNFGKYFLNKITTAHSVCIRPCAKYYTCYPHLVPTPL